MNEIKKEMTVPFSSVGADDGQSNHMYDDSITDTEEKSNTLEELAKKLNRMSNPYVLNTVTMSELYDSVYTNQPHIFDNFAVDYKKYDVIKGYRADDAYFSFANAFLNNTISVSQLEKAMVLGKLGEQVVAISQKAFNAFEFIEATVAPNEMYLPKKMARDSAARDEFKKEKSRGSVLTEKYILDIIREGWKNDDERLQRVVLG